MSLQQWVDNGWLRPHTTSAEEIANLLSIVDRDLSDAAKGISPDWRFGIAYNAALKLCTILLYSEGYRPERTLQHYRTIQSMPLILGDEHKSDAEYLEACRKKRNIAEYEYVGGITEKDAEELIVFTGGFRNEVLEWMKKHHPQLIKP
ncbi:MAG: hypothetical protein JRG73_20595 [Deltaproteobacteria bacterium]|nr:hypothetical protein [Deltaproteobacteria bacterium]MBW2309327.1 hypothetical protein [Deltaproteobacteria bacterium]